MTLIVVVDDHSTNQAIFSRLAKTIREGANVIGFSDPLEVLTWVQTQQPDLIITDYNMPGLDGAEFVRQLRTIETAADVPVIVITAYEDREFRLRALEAGATDFLQSPVDHQEFVTRGRNVLRLGEQQKIIRSRAEALQRELYRSEESLETTIRDSKVQLAQVIDTIPAAISASDQHGRRVFANRCSADMSVASAGHAKTELQEQERRILQGEIPMLCFEEEVLGGDGRQRTLLTSKYPLRDSTDVVRHVLTISFDISERKATERSLERLAHTDALTGLPNRLRLYSRLSEILALEADEAAGVALHLLDLDQFKTINDGFGHDQGDLLLQEVGARLLRVVRQPDMVARLGGDEFAIVQHGVSCPADAEKLAARVVSAIAAPFSIETYTAKVGASVGITMARAGADGPEQLLKQADLAMYRAKREGRGGLRFYEPEMQTQARRKVLLEIELRQGIENGELMMDYQLQCELRGSKVVGAESLLRWRRPIEGLMSPGIFLPMAEETGLILAIDRWVLLEVCGQAARWAAAGLRLPVAVNLSAATFKAESVLRLVEEALERTGLDPALLELELTEGTLMQHQADVVSDLRALRRIGVRIAIDDFGTGYSSLAYLQRLPIDRLKIDRSFIQGLSNGGNGGAIVEAIVAIGRSLNLEVLAEGVETAAQVEQLRSLGCELAQGYLFGKPVSPKQLVHDVLHPRSALSSVAAASSY